MAKKTERKSTVLDFIIKICFVVFLVYCAVTIVGTQIQIKDKTVQLEALQAKITAQEVKNEELRDLLENGIDDEYIAKIAREHGYALPDERVYESVEG
ncbi:MAG: septum formation initiator family protein [Clostridia bacterium]|nr:septum formation initiator family protein [Clostridia bacterium]